MTYLGFTTCQRRCWVCKAVPIFIWGCVAAVFLTVLAVLITLAL